MPRFFVDTDDGGSTIIDKTGYEFGDEDAACTDAVRALNEMAADALATGNRAADTRRVFRVWVRRRGEAPLYSACLTFECTGTAAP